MMALTEEQLAAQGVTKGARHKIIISIRKLKERHNILCQLEKVRRSCVHFEELCARYRGDDKSLARPGRKQATATEDFEFHISYL
jgi:hypothetical protein